MSNLNPSLAAYVPQDVRVVNVRTNLVPGYVTARLEPRLPWTVAQKPFSGSNVAYALAGCTAQVRNLSVKNAQQAMAPDGFAADVNDVVLQFQETDNEASSGARTKLGAAVVVKAGGTASVTFTPTQQFFEVKGIAGNGPVAIEIQTKIDWNERGFTEKMEMGVNPSSTWSTPDAISVQPSASQAFSSSALWTVVHNLGYVASATLISAAGTDITDLATFSSVTDSGYVATFGSGTPQAGTAYSTL